ncbi:hypothetical protein HDV05_003337 [Chytridiales sp. JEL 0842]|nr:hypothetical protein HDV05_003337 [Chytridiales sp. JEL 0842]
MSWHNFEQITGSRPIEFRLATESQPLSVKRPPGDDDDSRTSADIYRDLLLSAKSEKLESSSPTTSSKRSTLKASGVPVYEKFKIHPHQQGKRKRSSVEWVGDVLFVDGVRVSGDDETAESNDVVSPVHVPRQETTTPEPNDNAGKQHREEHHRTCKRRKEVHSSKDDHRVATRFGSNGLTTAQDSAAICHICASIQTTTVFSSTSSKSSSTVSFTSSASTHDAPAAKPLPKDHFTSISHLLSLAALKTPNPSSDPLPAPAPPPVRYAFNENDLPYRVLRSQGWSHGSGLGTALEGRKLPVVARIKGDRAGLGNSGKGPKVGEVPFVDVSRQAQKAQKAADGRVGKDNGPSGTGRMSKRQRDEKAMKEREERKKMMAYFAS